MSNGPVILAIDLGTTEIKSGLIDQGGRLVAATRAPHAIEIDALTGRAEQDPDAWWDGLRTIVRGLVASQPGSFVYASEGFVGASPELLVRRTGDVVESRPVAGTTVADSDEALLALAASVKDTREHRFVVDGIVDVLDARCEELTVATVSSSESHTNRLAVSGMPRESVATAFSW